MRTALLILILLLTQACGNGARTHITQGELLRQLRQNPPPLLVDVRSDWEYQTGHIPGALHIPFWQSFTSERLDSRQPAELLVLYCEHGPRAGIARWGWSLQGFTSIVYLEGHMGAWREAGLPVVAGGE